MAAAIAMSLQPQDGKAPVVDSAPTEQQQLEAALAMSLQPSMPPHCESQEAAEMAKAIQRSLAETQAPPQGTKADPGAQQLQPQPPTAGSSVTGSGAVEDHAARMRRLKEEWKRERAQKASPENAPQKAVEKAPEMVQAPTIDLCSPPVVVNLCDSSDSDDNLDEMYT